MQKDDKNVTHVTEEQAKLIDTVIKHIKKEDIASFNMNNWLGYDSTHICGTSACIGGFIELVINPAPKIVFGNLVVGNAIGLNRYDANNLFFGQNCEVPFSEIKAHHAIAALEDVKRTGRFTSWEDYV